MYRPRAFAIDDTAALFAVIRERVFATLALAREGRVHLAYAPVVLTGEGKGTIRFHLAKVNEVAALADGARLSVSFVGPDAYVSPDWYETPGLVPTWNYLAVEGAGAARKLSREETLSLLDDLSAQEEEKLRPKKPWTMAKVPEPRRVALLNAITGFSLEFETLEGKFKLSQDKKPEDFARVITALEARADAASLTVAAAMRAWMRVTAP
ncbi:MAG: FMN-binding negative transcriptional regulator [Alphaproteobacteria bacterium]|nr:FMN-binding negative transcriptional regulator [Alphaproteobacteria bacterium]